MDVLYVLLLLLFYPIISSSHSVGMHFFPSNECVLFRNHLALQDYIHKYIHTSNITYIRTYAMPENWSSFVYGMTKETAVKSKRRNYLLGIEPISTVQFFFRMDKTLRIVFFIFYTFIDVYFALLSVITWVQKLEESLILWFEAFAKQKAIIWLDCFFRPLYLVREMLIQKWHWSETFRTWVVWQKQAFVNTFLFFLS